MSKDATKADEWPEKFEDFEKQSEAPKRRRSTPAVRPVSRSESKKPKRPTAADVEGVGGMAETRWAGLPMWKCPKCHGTTFKEQDAKVHKCKQVRYADEEGLAD